MDDPTDTATRWLDAREQAAWRVFLEMQGRLAGQLNREMLERSGLSSADFAVLVQLSEHPDSRMRVLELARALRWEKSRLSHQLTRMTQRKLVERSYCSEDRRGAFVALTAQGQRTVERAAPAHVESVRRYLFDHLTDDQIDTLAAISQSVVDRIADTGERACDAVLDKECDDIGG